MTEQRAIDDPPTRAAMRRRWWWFGIATAVTVVSLVVLIANDVIGTRRVKEFTRNADTVTGVVREISKENADDHRVTVAYVHHDQPLAGTVEVEEGGDYQVGDPIVLAVNSADSGDVHIPGEGSEFRPLDGLEVWFALVVIIGPFVAVNHIVKIARTRRLLRRYPWRTVPVLWRGAGWIVVGDGDDPALLEFAHFAPWKWPTSVRVAGPVGNSRTNRSVVEVVTLRSEDGRTRRVTKLYRVRGPRPPRPPHGNGLASPSGPEAYPPPEAGRAR